MALVSLEAATRMLDLIPEPPDPFQLYQLAPWWCILHYLMQAATVLLLELSFASIHSPEDEGNTFKSAKKAIHWLYAMSEHSTASRRAWQLCDSCIRRIAVGMDYDVSDLPPVPSDAMLHQHFDYGASSADNAPITSATSGPAQRSFDWSTGMEPMTNFPAEARHQESNRDIDFEIAVSNAELVSYPMNFPASMSFTQAGELHFPYDPISGEFMGSFFPNPADDQYTWES